jgi:hypothetical protein
MEQCLLNNSRFLHSFKVKGSEFHNIIPEYASCTHIDKLQKRAARIILNATTETPSAVMFKKLEWLTIYNRYEIQIQLTDNNNIHM